MTALISQVIDNWASLYSNSAPIRTALGFAHVGGLIAGGGCAIAADRATIAAANEDAASQARHIHHIENVHRVVLGGLALVIASGVFLFLADTGTYLHSKVFFLKMAFVVALCINGARIVRLGRRAELGSRDAWIPFKRTAITSLALWFLTTLLGVTLPNVG